MELATSCPQTSLDLYLFYRLAIIVYFASSSQLFSAVITLVLVRLLSDPVCCSTKNFCSTSICGFVCIPLETVDPFLKISSLFPGQLLTLNSSTGAKPLNIDHQLHHDHVIKLSCILVRTVHLTYDM